nr:MAG TPA: hypothetical protein [Caudoviricetes sp.]
MNMITLAAPLWMLRRYHLPSDSIWVDILRFGIITILVLSIIVVIYSYLKDNGYI